MKSTRTIHLVAIEEYHLDVGDRGGAGGVRRGHVEAAAGVQRMGGTARRAGGRLLQGIQPRLCVTPVPQLQVRKGADAGGGGHVG